MKSYSIGKVAMKIGRTIVTLRKWDKEEVFKPFLITEGGHRFYSQKQLDYLLKLKSEKKLNKKTLCNMTSK